MAEHTESIDINASPQSVFAAVSDLPRMGSFSPENTGGAWLGGATGPSVGARFKGSNANGRKSWTTTATVVECDAPTSFSIEVTVGPAKVARWSYHVESTEAGSRVTESWIDRRSSLSKRLGALASGVANRDEFAPESIRTTLSNLKKALEPGA